MKMLVTTPFQRDPARMAKLEQQHDVKFVVPAEGQATTSLIQDADALFGQLTAEEFAHARNLKWVQSPSAGVEWLWRVPGIADSDIIVTNMRGAHAATIAEHTFAMLLAQTRGLFAFQQFQRDHEWSRSPVPLSNIKDLTMGIVGFGNIGRAIAHRATGFEMRVLAVDINPGPPGEGVEEVWPLERLNELCGLVDVLVISAPITPGTRGLIGKEQIGRIKRGSYLLAVSRGGIVEETALVDALEEGHLLGAGLDVTATEPLPRGDPLWTAPNLIITPHTSASSELTTTLVWSILSENVGRFLRGEELMNLVDKSRGW
jgi:phosphoglycerate dehydrogenase-like enzyme